MRRILTTATSIALAAASVLATPAVLSAQVAAPSGVRMVPRPMPSLPSAHLDTLDGMSRFPSRLGLSVIGGLAGLFGGAILASQLELGVDCDCDDPELGHAVSGAVVGVALGAALLAALPESTAACAYSARFLRALLGGALGVALGFVAPVDTRIVVVPLGGVVGAAVGAESCEWRRRS